MNMETDKKIYTVQEIMNILSISKNAAYKLIKTNPPFTVLHIGDIYRINKNSFDNWLINGS